MRKRSILNFSLFALLFSLSFGAFAETLSAVLKPQCTTKETGWDGVRHKCHSGWEHFSVPGDFIMLENSIEKSYSSRAGSENSCEHKFSNFIEVIPGTGLMQPRTLAVRAYARGPKGNASGRGWSKCNIKIDYSRYR